MCLLYNLYVYVFELLGYISSVEKKIMVLNWERYDRGFYVI